ncbi:hypothetical protein [Xenorhabdus bovienii]|uniref:hypothetical protein n=1 Tax=Xenorhabdus bovienii TaxID=40576 RepID=UPI00068956E6|nr:hypothetical protein [Xenorhabdus bovienii]MDE1491932.1 hypothetical protein [Xenorhabdus bovienii]MDE9436403.1 hypothetical protein [Xenorhabdus bovienii]MDE9447411.1 hypothetical protein [Xenorhabdus bovienii]MDE9462718.1 hypothetical protein [Xenorhabdus bovienii]MDE9470523.1 hypothetical protein [Xenorhabdus bovienii]
MAKNKLKRIKSPQDIQSNIGRLRIGPEFNDDSENRPPEFSLRYLQNNYCVDSCQRDEKAALSDSLFRLSQLTWSQIKQQHRHALGFEKIHRTAIKPAIPPHITEDVNLIAFRFSGMKPMVGYRRDSTFFIVWLDRDFTVYRHG